MRLAFDRLFGSSAEAREAADERDWRQHKWVIEPTRLGFFARAEELWRYRRIIWFFAVQRIKDRYEGTTLGPFWLFARPLMPILISTVVFGRLLSVPSDGVPYFLFYPGRVVVLADLRAIDALDDAEPRVRKGADQEGIFSSDHRADRLRSPCRYRVRDPVRAAGDLLLCLLVQGRRDVACGSAAGCSSASLRSSSRASARSRWDSGPRSSRSATKDVQYSVRYMTQFWNYATPVIYPCRRCRPSIGSSCT